MASSSLRSLTLGYVPGGTPAKWARIWAERHPGVPLRLNTVTAANAADEVRAGAVDVAVLRLPADTSGLAVIPLYEETTVAVMRTDHILSAADELTAADFEDEPILLPLDDVVDWADAPGARVEHRPETTESAIELVAAGIGVLMVPQSWRGCIAARTSRIVRSPTRPPARWRSPSRKGRSPR